MHVLFFHVNKHHLIRFFIVNLFKFHLMISSRTSIDHKFENCMKCSFLNYVRLQKYKFIIVYG
jgi:hypothetical protein